MNALVAERVTPDAALQAILPATALQAISPTLPPAERGLLRFITAGSVDDGTEW